MREIKFKAYHSEYGVGSVISMSFYEKTREINSDTECYVYYPKMNDSLLTSYNDVELMQYTGLKDNNGTEIYEGDIIWDAHAEILGKVTFDEGTFCVEWDTHIEHLFEVASDYYAEVIGNIYENPELLERE